MVNGAIPLLSAWNWTMRLVTSGVLPSTAKAPSGSVTVCLPGTIFPAETCRDFCFVRRSYSVN